MRIGQVTHNYLPHIGGLEFYVKRMIDSLEEKGIHADVLSTDMDTSIHERKPEARYFTTTFKFMRNPFSFELINYLRKADYDILHLHSVWFLHSLLTVAFRKKARIISTIHGVYPDKLNMKLKIFLSLYKPFVKYVLNKSEVIFVYSTIEKEKLKLHFNITSDKVRILPMAINVESCEDHVKDKFILFTGRIIPDKNPDVLIKATALLNDQLHEYKLIFVGSIEVDYKQKLIELAKDLNVKNEIVFVGQLDPSIEREKKKLLDYYRDASAFVSLGSWEGQPTRLMEAMQFKTPVIAFSAGGTEDFVTDNVNGLVITKLDEKMLATKLEMLLTNPELSMKIGEAGRKAIIENYNWDKIFERIFEVYKKNEKLELSSVASKPV